MLMHVSSIINLDYKQNKTLSFLSCLLMHMRIAHASWFHVQPTQTTMSLRRRPSKSCELLPACLITWRKWWYSTGKRRRSLSRSTAIRSLSHRCAISACRWVRRSLWRKRCCMALQCPSSPRSVSVVFERYDDLICVCLFVCLNRDFRQKRHSKQSLECERKNVLMKTLKVQWKHSLLLLVKL